MKKYDNLDRTILSEIMKGKNTLFSLSMSDDVWQEMKIVTTPQSTLISRRLQSLKKRGYIICIKDDIFSFWRLSDEFKKVFSENKTQKT